MITGGLANGGAEKQLIYLLKALKNFGVSVQIISTTLGDYHEQSLRDLAIPFSSTTNNNPAVRLGQIIMAIKSFKPHFIQSSHFYTNIYAGIAGRITGIPSIGAIRGDLYHDLAGVGRLGRMGLYLPTALLANSFNARENAIHLGIPPDRIYVLQNVIDLQGLDSQLGYTQSYFDPGGSIQVITVARLLPVKRLERFLKGLALARQQEPRLMGIIVGDGSDRKQLLELATHLGLHPNEEYGAVQFLGERRDIASLLSQSQIFVLTSEREGFPNVILEAMAAALPIVTTPAGECRHIIEDKVNGYLVAFDDQLILADRLITLARSPELRRQMGLAGRQIVEKKFSFSGFGEKLLDTYYAIGEQTRARAATEVIERLRAFQLTQQASIDRAPHDAVRENTPLQKNHIV